jgi:hypothetical protein
MQKPQIIIYFDVNGVTWYSVGWGTDSRLMKKAKEAINKGETPEEVIQLLLRHFQVIVV